MIRCRFQSLCRPTELCNCVCSYLLTHTYMHSIGHNIHPSTSYSFGAYKTRAQQAGNSRPWLHTNLAILLDFLMNCAEMAEQTELFMEWIYTWNWIGPLSGLCHFLLCMWSQVETCSWEPIWTKLRISVRDNHSWNKICESVCICVQPWKS